MRATGPVVSERTLPDEMADGRVARRERNRDAVVDAIMILIDAGETRPAMEDVARLAGVSERSVFRHFDSREALLAAVIERQVEMVTPMLREIPSTGPVSGRISAFVAERAILYEEITPMRRAAVHLADSSDLVGQRLAATRNELRDELEVVFGRELARRQVPARGDLLAALSVATSWEAWNLMRDVEGCSVTRARRVLVRLMTRLLAPS